MPGNTAGYHSRPAALRRAYSGLEAVEVFGLAGDFPDVLGVVKEILTTSYRIFLGAGGERFIAESLDALPWVWSGDDSGSLADLFTRRRAECERVSLLRDRVAYKEGSLLRSLRISGGDELSGVVIDVGAGDDAMGSLILKECPDVDLVIATDIKIQDVDGARLVLRKQEAPDRLPVGTGEADALIMRFCLHHMDYDTQIALLSEARRALKPSGRIIIFEDSYSSRYRPLVDHAIHARFAGLGDPIKHLIALAFLDASSCFLVEEVMPFHFTFRSIEGWEDLLCELGFSRRRVDYWGIPFFSLFQAPLGVLIYGLARNRRP